ncbi:hypothetical protein GCM10010964_17430 [Caldovatus sediminis]|uniref:Transposase InsH N-terminal domain-containing protein n=1 Tax=Caldovatus sediminis TaxID=2041189 RepID=A0A8J2ZB01_9PROT|nr:transposase [Caldovatus sediminis]GGG30019.1 hypothetical protein GCM10010964_17430 [Caldovatus sediminis]
MRTALESTCEPGGGAAAGGRGLQSPAGTHRRPGRPGADGFPARPAARRQGWSGYPPLAPFRALLLAQWYQLSDRGLEEALADRLPFRHFCGSGLDGGTPDETTLSRFRVALTERRLAEAAVARPPQSGAGISAKDPEAGCTRRSRRGFFGFKAQVAADLGSDLIRDAVLTGADVGDSLDAEAVGYELHHREGLARLLGDGRIELDTNAAERTIRPIRLGHRDAPLASGDDGGARRAAVASPLETCELNGVDPQAIRPRRRPASSTAGPTAVSKNPRRGAGPQPKRAGRQARPQRARRRAYRRHHEGFEEAPLLVRQRARINADLRPRDQPRITAAPGGIPPDSRLSMQPGSLDVRVADERAPVRGDRDRAGV